MSDFSKNKELRLKKLKEVADLLLWTGNAHSFVTKNTDFIQTVVPSDFIALFDEIVKEGHKMEDIKTMVNKILNIFYLPIKNAIRIEPKENTFLKILEENNYEMELLLDKISVSFKRFLKNPADFDSKNELLILFKELKVFVNHYSIKENVLFPIIETMWDDYRCLQIMWSFHDDIRRNIKTIITHLEGKEFDIKEFNSCVGDVFFDMMAIKFREEHILFPFILETIPDEKLVAMTKLGQEIGYPYIKPKVIAQSESNLNFIGEKINLGSGVVTIDQIRLIFNHLPVDITYVDENNKVCFFSTPKERLFPRTNAIIGREVNNCHPHESVHVVEKIVESFRCGEKDKASFWIQMRGKFILIQYFAVRDEKNCYKGVVEVSQEISEIMTLKGEKRLLDW